MTHPPFWCKFRARRIRSRITCWMNDPALHWAPVFLPESSPPLSQALVPLVMYPFRRTGSTSSTCSPFLSTLHRYLSILLFLSLSLSLSLPPYIGRVEKALSRRFPRILSITFPPFFPHAGEKYWKRWNGNRWTLCPRAPRLVKALATTRKSAPPPPSYNRPADV